MLDIAFNSKISRKMCFISVDPCLLSLYIALYHLLEIHNNIRVKHKPMDELDLKKLEARVDDLIKAVDRLQHENKTLRSSQTHLTKERNQLIEKTELAKTRVESMITRLRALENG